MHASFVAIVHGLALNKLLFQLNTTCRHPNIVQHVLSESIHFSKSQQLLVFWITMPIWQKVISLMTKTYMQVVLMLYSTRVFAGTELAWFGLIKSKTHLASHSDTELEKHP